MLSTLNLRLAAILVAKTTSKPVGLLGFRGPAIENCKHVTCLLFFYWKWLPCTVINSKADTITGSSGEI